MFVFPTVMTLYCEKRYDRKMLKKKDKKLHLIDDYSYKNKQFISNI